MPNVLWGKKRVCLGCSARYYDMMKVPPICPKCGVIIDVTLSNKSKKSLIINDDIDFAEFDAVLDDCQDNDPSEVLLDGVNSFDDDLSEITTFEDDEEM